MFNAILLLAWSWIPPPVEQAPVVEHLWLEVWHVPCVVPSPLPPLPSVFFWHFPQKPILPYVEVPHNGAVATLPVPAIHVSEEVSVPEHYKKRI